MLALEDLGHGVRENLLKMYCAAPMHIAAHNPATRLRYLNNRGGVVAVFGR
jgi:hypothetical protein